METRKLYYENSLLQEFSAAVTDCQPVKDGWEVTLTATAFYPEGGGQACDLGKLGGAEVKDVRERGEQVIHLCDRPLAVGSTVTGKIDWPRRFALMQQHSGEHIVSGLVHKHFGWHNVGFHMGKSAMEIDFDGPIEYADLMKIEREANEAVWANLPIKCWYPSREELPQVFYRRKKDLPWPVRIVEVPGFDSCACCGVHVPYTGQIGLIKILSCVKFHQGVRVELVCGSQALELMQGVFEQNRQVSQAFSAKLLQTGEAARRMNETLAEEKLRANTLQRQLFGIIARGYAGQNTVLHFADGLNPGAVRELADAIAGEIAGTAVVLSGLDSEGYTLCLVSKTEDVRPLGKAMTQTFSGRGGGKSDAFQGKLTAKKAEIEAWFRDNG